MAILDAPDALSRLKAHFREEQTRRETSQRQLELIGSIAAHANESRNFLATLQFALDNVCEATNWPIGHAYVADTDGSGALVSAKIWSLSAPVRHARFRAISEAQSLRPETDWLGLVAISRLPMWISDLTQQEGLLRREVAAEAGLRSWIAAPVLVGSEIVAVLEFFSDHHEERNDSLCKTITQIGMQLGRVLERERSENSLRELALHDALTGLPNRRLFHERLDQARQRQIRRECRIAVMFVDLDHFKSINDNYGHAVGDEVLRTIAGRLERCVRPGDTVSRFGGDEFVVLLDELRDHTAATRIAERVLQILRRPLRVCGEEMTVTASIGIASSDDALIETSCLLNNADGAMYRAKRAGRATYHIFDQEARDPTLPPRSIEYDLKTAFERGELRLSYQPLVSLVDQRIVGFEALLRWHRPDGRIVPPAGFMSTAEDATLIASIGRWAVEDALLQLRVWDEIFTVDPPLTMSLNLSAAQFAQPNLAAEIREILARAKIAPSRVRVQIAENILIDNGEATHERMAALQAIGVQTEVEDFGTAYSPLAYLLRTSLDTLKIDPVFTARLGSRGEAFELVRTMVALARNLGMKVVAEGIETEEQLTALRDLNCDYGLGRLFTKPLSVEEVEGMLEKDAPRLSRQA